MSERLPWEVVETLPSTDASAVAEWDRAVEAADSDVDRARALIGSALSRYWAVHEGVITGTVAQGFEDRWTRTDEAIALARSSGDADLLAEALLGRLYACWGPLHTESARDETLDELVELSPSVDDAELRLRIREWVVTRHFDHGRLSEAHEEVRAFRSDPRASEMVLFRRRHELWRANLAMLEGRLDDAVRINQDAISATADSAGSPFSFQNVAITLAIERYLRRGLADLVEVLRSIRESSPRVAGNWDAGIAFTLAEIGELDDARSLFEEIVVDDFVRVPPDLNWLVTMQLLGLVAHHLDDRPRMARLHELLYPFAHLDGTHGSGYASYGPVARVVGILQGALDPGDGGWEHFDRIARQRAAGPWTSLARHDAALVGGHARPFDALAAAERATSELRDLDMHGWAHRAEHLAADLLLEGHGGPVAVLADGRWRLRHEAGTASVADAVGVQHLVQLLARPGRSIPVLELAPQDVIADADRASADVTHLDEQARAAYRRRATELEASRDPDDEELAFLRRELAANRFVRSGSAEAERARVRVRKAISRVLDAIEHDSPGLDAHLRSTIETGRQCLYAPPDGVAWRIIRR